MSRRDFVRVGGATAVLMGLSTSLLGQFVSPLVSLEEGAKEQWFYGYCKMCLVPGCGMRIKKKNGVVVSVEGDQDHPVNKGRLCPRGNANIRNLYNPYRVKAPMKRTNPQKGLDQDPGWVEISWDEALDTVAGKLREIWKTDPRGLLGINGFGSIYDDLPMSRAVFPMAFGTPNFMEINGPLCPVHYGPLNIHGTFVDRTDLQHTKYVILMGVQGGGELTTASGPTKVLADALNNGLKVVSISPSTNIDTAKGEWVPLKPGTDLPVLMAMANVMVHEIGKLDFEHLKERTNAPYLIKDDGHYARHPKTGKPLLWDLNRKKAVSFNDPNLGDVALTGDYEAFGQKVRPAFACLSDHFKKFTPEEAEKISDVPAATIRRISKEYIEAAHIGSIIDIDGVSFPYRPVILTTGRGAISHRGGAYVMLANNIILSLVGASDVPGSKLGDKNGTFLEPGPDGTVQPDPRKDPRAEEWVMEEFHYPVQKMDMSQFHPNRHSTSFAAWRAVLEPQKHHLDYEAKAMFIHSANPFTNHVNREDVTKAFQKIPFSFSIAYHFDEPTQFCDILLPESANMERLNVTYHKDSFFGMNDDSRGLQGIGFKHPVVDPVYNSRDANTILLDLMERIGGMRPAVNGILNGFMRLKGEYQLAPMQAYKWEGIIDRHLKSNFGANKGIKYFVKHGASWTYKKLPLKETYNYYHFPKNKTRIPIYFDYLKWTGEEVVKNCEKHGITIPGWDHDKYLKFFQPMPEWIPHPEHEAAPEFDMFAVNWKIATRHLGIGALEEDPAVREMHKLFHPDVDVILINSKTASEKGIKNKDRIRVVSQYGGSLEGVIGTTELLHPEVLGFAGNFGRPSKLMPEHSKRGLNYNVLLTAGEGDFDPVVGGIENTAAVKIEKI